jgi:hypothetical protein
VEVEMDDGATITELYKAADKYAVDDLKVF